MASESMDREHWLLGSLILKKLNELPSVSRIICLIQRSNAGEKLIDVAGDTEKKITFLIVDYIAVDFGLEPPTL